MHDFFDSDQGFYLVNKNPCVASWRGFFPPGSERVEDVATFHGAGVFSRVAKELQMRLRYEKQELPDLPVPVRIFNQI